MIAARFFAVAVAVLGAGALAGTALLALSPAREVAAPASPAWAEVAWPFSMDQWGRGKAYRCGAVHCGAEVYLYLRAKIGFCNCTTGVADDNELDRMSDFDLVGGAVTPLGGGREIAVGTMRGRSRAYTLPARAAGKTLLSVAFNDRCDMAVATVVLPHDQPSAVEPRVIAFLNSASVRRWVEIAFGL